MTTTKTTEAAASHRASGVAQGSTGATRPESRPAASGGFQQHLDFPAINKRLWAENVYLRMRVKSLAVTVRNLRRALQSKGHHE